MKLVSRMMAILLLSVTVTSVSTLVAAEPSWQPLFNGKNLDGWHTMFSDKYGKNEDPERIFQVHDGMIHIYKDLAHGSDIPWAYFGTNKEYSNYRLRFQYKWGTKTFSRRTNKKRDSGVLYHCVGPERVWPMCVECQIQEGDTGDFFTVGTRLTTTMDPDQESHKQLCHYKEGGISKTQGIRGRICRVVKAGTHEADGWNTVEVIIKGDRAVHIVNGHVNNQCQDMRMPDPNNPDQWLPLTKGKIVFQAEGAEVFYRNIELKQLSAEKTPAALEQITITDPASGGRDLELQGEYAGKSAGQSQSLGAQVIARGDGRFELVLFTGGLPGDGWNRGDAMQKAEGETRGDATHFSSSTWSAKLQKGTLTLLDSDGTLTVLKKVDRQSPTLGAKPPQGALVLFDGNSAENFEGGKVVMGDLLLSGGESVDKFAFADHSIHLEFRTPFKPFATGQQRGNSGVYVQNRYEVQVLDSFGLEGKENECGGIYSISAPDVNMCFPPLEWQTYDIDFTAARYGDDGSKLKNARITVHHNGVVIHDDRELPKSTPGKMSEGPGPEGLYLQGHGNPVVYRNIWVVAK